MTCSQKAFLLEKYSEIIVIGEVHEFGEVTHKSVFHFSDLTELISFTENPEAEGFDYTYTLNEEQYLEFKETGKTPF